MYGVSNQVMTIGPSSRRGVGYTADRNIVNSRIRADHFVLRTADNVVVALMAARLIRIASRPCASVHVLVAGSHALTAPDALAFVTATRRPSPM
ncbi:hypothetical protein AYO38_09205 [bacterium SCGC AG-212-C10]|nr:hypothetical protein AYO38_09205 [bacterium SCGC AG-212-C10]